MTVSTISPLNTVKVNVRLCGSIPRKEMEALSLNKSEPLVLHSSHEPNTSSYLGKADSHQAHDSLCLKQRIMEEDVALKLCSQLSEMRGKQPDQQVTGLKRRVTPTFEAPTWAVPANGEARLEPVCDSVGLQSHVDLTEQAVFCIGRSPQSDVQLLHATSSRRHAMVFHHSNGSCYIVDCGSAHGTFVNGVRITSAPSKGGTVIPHKVKKGSLIRFGGPGAPQFMLKSFAFALEDMKETPAFSSASSPLSPAGAVVEHNTRLNALGKTAKDCLVLSLTSKRSFESMDTIEDCDYDPKRRCSSPPLSPERQPLRLVSPDMSGQPMKRRRVSFSTAPPSACYPALISPDLSGDENDIDSEESI